MHLILNASYAQLYRYRDAFCIFIRHAEVEHLLVGSIGTLFTSKVTESIIGEYGNLAGYALQLLGNVYR